MSELTIGIDIGTTSVKAVAADPDGNVVARSRVRHPIEIPAADRFQHDAARAWRRGPRRALAALGDVARDAKAVSVAAMVPSVTAVDARGIPRTPGLLYGDVRGRTEDAGEIAESGELFRFLEWTREQFPDARGYWPAPTVANYALGGAPVVDTTTAATAYPLFDWVGWDEQVAASLGLRTDQLPKIVPTGWEAGRIGRDGPVLASGCIDALCEQIVAGADEDGDVMVICGTTLITWIVVPADAVPEVPGYYAIPHTTQGKMLVGGPSNAGGLFLNWARGLLGRATGPVDPDRVPVWAPYVRGERTPTRDPDRRAALADLDLTHDAAAIGRAAYEAAGFVVRRAIEASGVSVRRIIATGGGIRVDPWVQALADCTGSAVECVAVPEGGALGSAFLARMAAGLETGMADARRWARTGRTVEPDPRWRQPLARRYQRFLELSR
ncbi:MAG: FGGY-family carbohydrate kinase [Acidimicrobiia bacterium]